ncbi:MAG: amidohydrolase [Bacteroidales bacterium]
MNNKLSVHFLQSSIIWQDPEKNRLYYEHLLTTVKNTDVLVFPEMFTTGFSMNPEELAEPHPGESLAQMQVWAVEKNALIVGSLMIKVQSVYYNRLYLVKPDGSFDYYDKRHLFRMGNEHEHYAAGTDRLITHWRGWRICPLICYDLRFPVWSRNRNDYDLLLYVANWPESRSGVWKTLLEARALENQAYCLGVNRVGTDGNDLTYSGDSRCISPKGEILAQAQPGKEEIVHIMLDKEELDSFRAKFPAHLDADTFHIDM